MEKQLLSKEAISDLEKRIQSEEFSSRLYEDMSLWFEDKGYVNLAKLYSKHSAEEMSHAKFAKDFLLSYNLKPCLKVLQSPEAEYSSCLDVLEATRDHEILVTNECQSLAQGALKRGEMTLFSLGQKYCTEQIEELKKSYDLISSYKLSTCDLFFDHYVGENYN